MILSTATWVILSTVCFYYPTIATPEKLIEIEAREMIPYERLGGMQYCIQQARISSSSETVKGETAYAISECSNSKHRWIYQKCYEKFTCRVCFECGRKERYVSDVPIWEP